MTELPRWTTAADIEVKLERLWARGRFLTDDLEGGVDRPALFPIRLPLTRPEGRLLAERFEDVRRWIENLQAGSRAARGFGYDIVWREIDHRQLGRQAVPEAVLLPEKKEALALLGKQRAADRFSRLTAATDASFPELRGWLSRRPFAALEQADDWDRILAVLAWLREHPRPGTYLRQLEIPNVDTKFIESRRGLFSELLDLILPAAAVDAGASGTRQFEARYGLLAKPSLVRFRLLDPLQQIGPLSDIATPTAEFARLDPPATRVFITENEVNGLAFPSVPESIVIFGLGYGLERLGDIAWLRSRAVYYWGDIDTHGFAILDRLRFGVPHAQSFLMDRGTLMEHRDLWAKEDSVHEGLVGRLTSAERELYEELKANRHGEGVRLEQERIGFAWLRNALRVVP
jgi:hypothetical protein